MHTLSMNIVAQIFVVVAGLLHVLIFCMESLLFTSPQVHRRFQVRAEDVPVIRSWALNQGFYNLFLALGALAGVLLVHIGDITVGRTLSLFSCACMLGAAVVLMAGGRRMMRGALMQGLPPLIALAAALA